MEVEQEALDGRQEENPQALRCLSVLHTRGVTVRQEVHQPLGQTYRYTDRRVRHRQEAAVRRAAERRRQLLEAGGDPAESLLSALALALLPPPRRQLVYRTTPPAHDVIAFPPHRQTSVSGIHLSR
ncbi:hypothetical protein EYF80_037472 [Liparis tanakae]|uniref:Uncharacterized protein n=1 Tax=Liparis tanakae TaxID=230148 RepID=A0A4Z2GFL1_9TELE|nr:hypothetical protein EYF80_037472 [Liparis tanakae]